MKVKELIRLLLVEDPESICYIYSAGYYDKVDYIESGVYLEEERDFIIGDDIKPNCIRIGWNERG